MKIKSSNYHAQGSPEVSGRSQGFLDRRRFLQTAVTGVGGLALGGLVGTLSYPLRAETEEVESVFHLGMGEALVEMVDLSKAYTWLFFDRDTPRFPGPVLHVTEGEKVRIKVSNHLPLHNKHAFQIPGVVDSGPIPSGSSVTITFIAPPAGTYIYHDPMNAPINRVMGLHGVLVSLPHGSHQHVHIPYSNPTRPVHALFDHFGTTPRFPGDPWRPDQSVIWAFHQIDPDLNEAVGKGIVTDPLEFVRLFQPRYFSINGRTGYFSAYADDTMLSSTVGYPHLIRSVNTGLWAHSPHTHANHVYRVAANGQVQNNVFLLDSWTIKPMERIDTVFPFIIPPDIPEETWEKVVTGVQEEPFPMVYPMHCHTEISLTADGGNYPHGVITHIEILGPHNQIADPGNPPPGYPVHDHGFRQQRAIELRRPGTPTFLANP